jgi:putative membrane protein
MSIKFFSLAVVICSLAACIKADDNANLNDVNQADRDFIFKASFANSNELAISRLADTVASDTALRKFAHQLVEKHSALRSSFDKVASGFSYYAGDSLNAESLALQQQLLGLNGRAFDSVYIHSRLANQTLLLNSFNEEVNNGINTKLKAFAAANIPLLQANKKTADSLVQFFK